MGHSVGSAGGPGGLRPQHLKDLIGCPSVREPLLTALASFATLIMDGKTPLPIRSSFFGATLIALCKRGGGVRPIAVGSSLRHLVAKVSEKKVTDDMCNLLAWDMAPGEAQRQQSMLPGYIFVTSNQAKY